MSDTAGMRGVAVSVAAAEGFAVLREENRDALGGILQAVLVDLIDLAAAGKQLHWNVIGAGFRSLHLQLDELVDSARDMADEVAERGRAIGWTPDGRTPTVFGDSSLPGVSGGELPVGNVIGLVAALLSACATSARRAAAEAGEYDAVTQDLLVQVVQTLEQHAWMFAAQGRG